MKVIGGSFGSSGFALIADGKLHINSSKSVMAKPAAIAKMEFSIGTDKKFAVISFFIGAIILAVILGFLLSILGVFLGVILAFVGSYYTKKESRAEIDFQNGEHVTLICSKREVDELSAFKG